ncbi:IclR family transcriptional regulator [Niallia taxi]|uniref:IclR family transcriptional regulator n=1 Tax=Niallia taxi TaxID=2499688 RepID=UPI0011A5E6C7|nr:IclR family transcriptional regulator [Niallia taxi]MCT2343666.1 IclR family transcriptional regulator [Niallia taxi]MED3965295.1 IclR family transcriptional regulator [Niallia taxi]WOD62874.1 IclR family transcriptional regulator [Niallia taxi]
MSNVQSLERALTILNKLSEYPDGLQIARLSEQVGLSKSTVHRLLATLTNMNYVEKDMDTDKYKLGLQTLFLARNFLNSNTLVHTAKPFLTKLCKEVNETIHLCTQDREEVLYVDKIESTQTIRMFSRVGSRAPMYCTAVGKVLLSGLDPEALEESLSKMEFVSKTAATISSKEELREEIDKVEQQGYALDNNENEKDLRCIAAPIYNHEGRIIASFSISGPSTRVTMDLINEVLVEKMQHYSADISRHFGFIS